MYVLYLLQQGAGHDELTFDVRLWSAFRKPTYRLPARPAASLRNTGALTSKHSTWQR